MDVDMRVFLTESIGYSYPLNESSKESSKSDDRKFSDKLNDILTPIIKKMRELFERFKTKFGSIINKILTKLGLNPNKDLKTFKEALSELGSRFHTYNILKVEKLNYSYCLENNFTIIDKVVKMYKSVMNDISLCFSGSRVRMHLYETLFDIKFSSYDFTWENIDNWGEIMRKVLTPVSEECVVLDLYSHNEPNSIYSPDALDEILRRGKSEYINSINNKVSSLKNNINDIINDGKNELKSSVKNDKEKEKLALEKLSKLVSSIPPVMLAVTNGVMGAAAESCRRVVILAKIVNKLNRENGYGDVVNVPDEDEVAVAQSSTSFSNLMR